MKNLQYFILFLIISSCAQFVPPTGGENDKKPPILLSSTPTNKTKNFKNKTITLTFDEYLDINSLKQELLITPEINGLYNAKMKDNTIKIILDGNLDSNTTYTFNFRNGIKDLNEKNPAKNLKLVLSTGSQIDSLAFSGTITDIHTKNPVLEATVALYAISEKKPESIKDSIPLLKRKPNYFTKTDSSGKYNFENIKSNKYLLIAFLDKNQNLLYEQKTESFGYDKDTIQLDSNIKNKDLEIYKANFTKNKIKRSISRENTFVIQLEKEISKAKVEFDKKSDSIDYSYNASNISIFKLKPVKTDTIYSTLYVTDSLNITDTLQQKIYFSPTNTVSKKKTLERMSIISNIKNEQNITNNVLYDLKFEYPITRFDTAKVIFKTDTVKAEKLNYKFISSTHINIFINTKAKKQIELFIPSNTIQNFKGDTNSMFYIKNNVLQKDDLGNLAGNVKNKKGTKIVQLLDSESFAIINQLTTTDKFIFNDVIPGTYILRTIFDENNNGVWDPGNFEKKIQPEQINIRKEPIKIRANFEIKDIILN